MKNKKAQLQVPGAAVSIYSYLLFALMIIIFLFLFSIRSCTDFRTETDNILSDTRNLDYPVLLLNYLRTEKNNTNIAQLIPLYIKRDPGKTKFPEQLKNEVVNSSHRENVGRIGRSTNIAPGVIARISCAGNTDHSFCCSHAIGY